MTAPVITRPAFIASTADDWTPLAAADLPAFLREWLAASPRQEIWLREHGSDRVLNVCTGTTAVQVIRPDGTVAAEFPLTAPEEGK